MRIIRVYAHNLRLCNFLLDLSVSQSSKGGEDVFQLSAKTRGPQSAMPPGGASTVGPDVLFVRERRRIVLAIQSDRKTHARRSNPPPC